jgi:hypothetical protein
MLALQGEEEAQRRPVMAGSKELKHVNMAHSYLPVNNSAKEDRFFGPKCLHMSEERPNAVGLQWGFPAQISSLVEESSV